MTRFQKKKNRSHLSGGETPNATTEVVDDHRINHNHIKAAGHAHRLTTTTTTPLSEVTCPQNGGHERTKLLELIPPNGRCQQPDPITTTMRIYNDEAPSSAAETNL